MNLARPLFLVLLFANLLLFAWWQGYLAPWGPSAAREPQRLAAQIAPDTLRLITPEVAAKEQEAAATTTASAVCHAIDGLKDVDLQALLAAPEPLPGLTLTTHEVDSVPGYQVAIRALTSQAAAQAKQTEVKALGVELPTAIAAEGDTFRLILARAPDLAAAEAALVRLQEKGIKTARVVALPAIKRTRLQVHGDDTAFALLSARLASLKDVRINPCEKN